MSDAGLGHALSRRIKEELFHGNPQRLGRGRRGGPRSGPLEKAARIREKIKGDFSLRRPTISSRKTSRDAKTAQERDRQKKCRPASLGMTVFRVAVSCRS